MGKYKCNICKKIKDNDVEVCHTDPIDSQELICDDCHEDHEHLMKLENLTLEGNKQWTEK